MNIQGFIKLRLTTVILFVLLLLCAVIGFLYYRELENKMIALYGGLLTGLIVLVIQFSLDWQSHREREELRALGVIKILPDRNDKNYYQKYVSSAKRSIDLFGVTASRFLSDFCDDTNSSSDALIQALKKSDKLKVKFLIAKKLTDPTEKNNLDNSKRKLEALRNKYPTQIEYTFYDHPPTHSILKIDNYVFIGPHFPGVSSKSTPTLHTTTESVFAEGYLEYFDKEWGQYNNANPNQP